MNLKYIKFNIFILMFFITGLVYCQSGIYTSVDLKLLQVNNTLGVIGGVQAGYRLSGGLEIGLGIYDLLNTVPVSESAQAKRNATDYTKLHYGGVIFGYNYTLRNDWHITPKLLIGVGDVSKYRDKKANDFDWSWHWIIEPVLGAEYLVSGHWSLGMELGCTMPLNQDTVKYKDTLTRLLYGITAKYSFY